MRLLFSTTCKFVLLLSILFIFIRCTDETTSKESTAEGVKTEDEYTDEMGQEKDTISNNLEKDKELKKALPAPDYDTLKWTELIRLDSHFIVDLKYATIDNFVEEQMYACGRCFLRPKAAIALHNIQQELDNQGLRIKLLDCYRPRPVQQRLWNKVPDKRYVTPPAKGSMHNRGAAVDLTIVGKDGKEWDMGTPYDFFGKEAWPEYQNLPKEVLENRRFLKEIMEENGFKGIRTEWWHFSFPKSGATLSDWEWKCPQ